LYGWHGWSILGAVWTMTGLGTAFKLFSTGRFVLTSTIFYVLMGWFITIAIIPLSRALPLEGMIWLIAGGACYTLGALIYLWDERLPFSHPLFHLFVLAGSACHFLLVYQVVLFMA
ncbi:MAG: hemolysin III family protein, partial [Deltaproteobacteria bacterium]|nr:hemolysin III family protein [Deltaproteobacteria bacterium]